MARRRRSGRRSFGGSRRNASGFLQQLFVPAGYGFVRDQAAATVSNMVPDIGNFGANGDEIKLGLVGAAAAYFGSGQIASAGVDVMKIETFNLTRNFKQSGSAGTTTVAGSGSNINGWQN